MLQIDDHESRRAVEEWCVDAPGTRGVWVWGFRVSGLQVNCVRSRPPFQIHHTHKIHHETPQTEADDDTTAQNTAGSRRRKAWRIIQVSEDEKSAKQPKRTLNPEPWCPLVVLHRAFEDKLVVVCALTAASPRSLVLTLKR